LPVFANVMQLRAGDLRNGGQPVRTTALVQLGRDGQAAVAACIDGSKTVPNPDTLGGTLRLSISSTASNPTQVFIPPIRVCEMCARLRPGGIPEQDIDVGIRRHPDLHRDYLRKNHIGARLVILISAGCDRDLLAIIYNDAGSAWLRLKRDRRGGDAGVGVCAAARSSQRRSGRDTASAGRLWRCR